MEMDSIIVRTIISLLFLFGVGKLNAQGKKFQVFDAILYEGKPNLEKYGLKKMFVLYEDEVISTNYRQSNTKAKNRRYIDFEKLRSKATHTYKKSYPVCIDVEFWNLYNENTREYALDQYINIIKSYRNIDSKNYISLFHYSSINKDLFDISNVVFPAYYTHSQNFKDWENMVRSSVTKMRKWGNKPIYAFIWPQYNQNDVLGPLSLTFIPHKEFRQQLELLYNLCDGIVIWTNKKDNKGNVIKFHKNMPWFKEVRNFIKEKNI